MPVDFSQFISSRKIQYRSHSLSFTLFLNEIDSAERILHSFVAFKSISVVELFDLSVTGLPVPSSEFTVWSEPNSTSTTALDIEFIFIPHLRFFHFVTFREVSLFCAADLSALSLNLTS